MVGGRWWGVVWKIAISVQMRLRASQGERREGEGGWPYTEGLGTSNCLGTGSFLCGRA